MAGVLEDVAIIGAGLSGTTLALALNQRSISCRVYEARDENSEALGSGVSLAPNGCRVLDVLGVLERIKPKCYQTEFHVFKNAKGQTTGKSNVASEELYGYKNHRIYRQALIGELRAVLKERNIPVEYGAKFEKVVEEKTYSVTFLVGGRTERATLLIGADGINSAVRKYLTTEVPEYMGLVCIYGHVFTDSISWPNEDFEKVCTIQDKPGALFMIPEVRDGSDLMVGRQFSYPSMDRARWDALAADKDQLYALFRNDYDEWHHIAKSIMDQVSTRKDGLLLWPFRRMPKLERWASPTGRIIIIGDAAHAMPPSSGQGVNQAFEDAYSLAVLLSLLPFKKNLNETLDYWHNLRQARIDRILEMAEGTNIMRLPEADRLKLMQKRELTDHSELQSPEDRMRWLFRPDTDEDITAWVKAHV